MTELCTLCQLDALTFESMKEALTNNSRQFFVPFKTLVNDDRLYLQSTLFSDGIPVFLIKIYNDFKV